MKHKATVRKVLMVFVLATWKVSGFGPMELNLESILLVRTQAILP